MRTVKLVVAKSQLSRLADQAAAGEEIVITRQGVPVARLMPLSTTAHELPRAPADLLPRALEAAPDI